MSSIERKKELEQFLTEIGITLNDLTNLSIALTHSSYTYENKLSIKSNNERLEFLGDAVLKLITSDYLYERFPDYTEGELTKIRSVLVSDSTLTKLAKKINLNKYLKLGYHEEKLGGRMRNSNLACAFEAILGSFYRDGKYKEIKQFLIKLMEDEVTAIDKCEAKSNYKAILQEYAQSKGIELPEYKVINEEGPAHDKIFEIIVIMENQNLGIGKGKSKKQAQQDAAKEAVVKLNLVEIENEYE
jgi:ribonuclease III